jgi:hypothetical protein
MEKPSLKLLLENGVTYPIARNSFKDMKKFRSDANVLLNTKFNDKYYAVSI